VQYDTHLTDIQIHTTLLQWLWIDPSGRQRPNIQFISQSIT